MASVSCFMTSTRRIWPLTFNVISRSTEPGIEPCPRTASGPRKRYAEAETVAPVAITPLMNDRREKGLDCCCGVCIAIVMGRSPRHVTRTGSHHQQDYGSAGFWRTYPIKGGQSAQGCLNQRKRGLRGTIPAG